MTINSNFSTKTHSDLSYLRNELDAIDLNEKNPTLFRLTIQIINLSRDTLEKQDSFSEQLNQTLKQPLTLFGDEYQLQKAINDNSNQNSSLLSLKYLLLLFRSTNQTAKL